MHSKGVKNFTSWIMKQLVCYPGVGDFISRIMRLVRYPSGQHTTLSNPWEVKKKQLYITDRQVQQAVTGNVSAAGLAITSLHYPDNVDNVV
jgi:hypothetical protein